jgi:hypothetical protein
MKLSTSPRVALQDANLQRVLREHANQVNAMSEGRIAAAYNAQTSAPTTGDYAVGDFVRNSAPSELGSPGSAYIIFGWMCVDDSPLTFVDMRFLTGN